MFPLFQGAHLLPNAVRWALGCAGRPCFVGSAGVSWWQLVPSDPHPPLPTLVARSQEPRFSDLHWPRLVSSHPTPKTGQQNGPEQPTKDQKLLDTQYAQDITYYPVGMHVLTYTFDVVGHQARR